MESRLRGEQASQHQQRAGDVGREMRGVRAQRGTVFAAGSHQRHGHARGFEDQRGADRRELIPVHGRFAGAAGEARDRLDAHEHAAGQQQRSLPERSEVLGAAVTVGVLEVGGPAAEFDREERQHGGDHVAA